MATWSKILFSAGQKLFKPQGLLVKTVPKNASVRCMSHNSMIIRATDWQYHKVKDWFHFYFFVGLIPILCVVTYANVFIGPATLSPIPEGYVPKNWEYYRSPISRFFARYLCINNQESYERVMLHKVRSMEIREMRVLHDKMKDYIYEYQDYNAVSFKRDITAADVLAYRKYRDEKSRF
ncbi:NADH dehydrogenase (ubiquinone) SGDH subunit [Augochlora pura]